MADATNRGLRVVVVTPERAVLDEPADSVVLPLYDGEAGVLPGHAAFVGQLAPGELRLGSGPAAKRFYIDGGFAQVTGSVVNVLTARAIPAASLTAESVTAARTAADALPDATPVERDTRTRAVARAQGMAKVAGAKA